MSLMDLDKLDRLAAERVMGWYPAEGSDAHGKIPGDFWLDDSAGPPRAVMDWQPTRNIAQAWECLEKMEGSYNVTWNPLHNSWFCSLWDKSHTAEAETAPLAIILTCLKAKGVEV